MSDHFHKFLFLGVMIVLVVFANRATVAKQSLNMNYGAATTSKTAGTVPPPVFILESPRGSAPNAAAVSAVQTVDAVPTFTAASGIVSVQSQTIPDTTASPSPSSAASFGASGASSVLFTRTGDAPPPGISAHIALVADVRNGIHFLDAYSDTRWPLASLTKLMTAVVAFGHLDMNATATVSAADFAVDTNDQYLRPGDTYTISDLMRILLLPSSNVAAETIAGAYPEISPGTGGRDGFLAAMNAQAREWGMFDTHYDDPSGLSVASESSADDIFTIVERIYAEYPQIFSITRTPSVYVTELGAKKRMLVKSINYFAGQADFIGGKTGYTDEAEQNLASLFSYNKKAVAIAVLGTSDRFGDTQKLLQWFEANYK